MAVRTVTVDLRLDAGSYLAIARSVVRANQGIDNSLNDIGASAAAAGSAMNHMGRDMQRMGARARLAERRIRELREEIDRLIAAQAAYAAGAPLPNIPASGGAAGGRGMMGMLANPMILGAAGLAVAAAGPAIGAMIGGLVLTALGTVALAPGIIAALQDDAVQHAFIDFGDFAKAEFKSYGEAFEVPLIGAAEHFHDRFATISPKIRSGLAEMAVAVRPLADGLAGFVEKAGPGIMAGLRGSLPVLKAFAAELPQLGKAAGDFFKLVAGGSEGAADGIVTFLKLLELGGYALGGWILYLEKIYALAGDLPAGLKALLGPGAALMGQGDTKQMIDLSGSTDQLYQVGFAAAAAETHVRNLHTMLLGLADGFNNTYSAAINYEQAIDDLTESVKENGRSLDIGSQKGRDNANALMAVFAAARATYDANIASGMSAQEAARKYNEQIEKAKQTARAAGLAADEVNRLAAAQRNLPTGTKTFTYKTIFVTEGRSPGGVGGGTNRYAMRDGGIIAARDGIMAGGVFTGGHPLIKFAETGVGREAFIAQNAPAGRSLALANTAAGWHGGQVVPKGWGGGGTTVVIRPAPTNANRAVVDAVTEQIRVDIQRQSRGDTNRHFGGSNKL